VGVHWQTVSHLEKGKYPFSVTTFARLTHALELSANRLLEGLPEPDKQRITEVKRMMARKRRPDKKAPA
jgi:hypothetical protein